MIKPYSEPVPHDNGAWRVVVPGMIAGDGYIQLDRTGRLSLSGISFSLTPGEAAQVSDALRLALELYGKQEQA